MPGVEACKREGARLAAAGRRWATTSVTTASPAGAAGGQATEWTQLLNNGELISLVGKSAEQINNQITQISQLAEQIQNQLRIYENMLQNTRSCPIHIWGQVERDLNKLRSRRQQGQGIAFSMGNADDVLKQRFQSYAEFKTNCLANGESFLGKRLSEAGRHQSRHDRRNAEGGRPDRRSVRIRGIDDEPAALHVGIGRRPDEGAAGRHMRSPPSRSRRCRSCAASSRSR
jgi:hypothetical protein